ncbi:heparinase II/III domain-containing protein [Paenibacillus sp. 1-18]|uniref:heparinase II/III domain-containing protein n=1 Tax=Paenibacillus sp. 1-18 TaxID=1333846 RepID=UPI0004B32426|nr:heparinase II/III family protein [Paenibacillus sp. 1-18]
MSLLKEAWPASRLVTMLDGGVQDTARQRLRSEWTKRLRATVAEPVYAELWMDIERVCKNSRETPWPELSFPLFQQFAHTGERKPYEDVYFEQRGRLAALVLAAVADSEPWRMKEVENGLLEICQEYTWALPAHVREEDTVTPPWQQVDLFASETAQMLAEILLLLGEELNGHVVAGVREEVERRVLEPVFWQPRHFEWETAEHNWAAVCASGCGIAALLLTEDSQGKAVAIEKMLGTLDYFLEGYGEDGGCPEGVGYWVYGFGYFIYFADMLRAFSGEAVNILTSEKIGEIAAFAERVHLSDGIFANYSDSSETERLPSGLVSNLNDLQGRRSALPFHVSGLLEDPCRRWAHVLRNLVWTNPLAFGSGEAAVDYLPQLGWMMCRSRSSSRSSSHSSSHGRAARTKAGSGAMLAFSAKGGHNNEPHNHNDLGHFILHGDGENLLCDLGAGLYTKAYFSPGRESIVNISSGGHSVPVVNGTMQQSGARAKAVVLDIAVDEQKEARTGTRLKLDLTSAYPAEELTVFTRSFAWTVLEGNEGARLTITDHFEFESSGVSMKPWDVEELLISRFQPRTGAGFVEWQGTKAAVRLDYDANMLRPRIEAVKHVDHDGVSFVFYKTSLKWCSDRKPH